MGINKYGAKKITAPDGQKFDSKREYHRWCILKLMERGGKISNLKRQVTFELIPTQRETSTEVYKAGPQKGLPKPGAVLEKACTYVADYVYKDSYGKIHVEDVKGYKGGGAYAVFSIKRKLMLHVHGIVVEEV